MSEKCVICGSPIPKDRKKKDTCTYMHGLEKLQAWSRYLNKHAPELMKAALEEWREAGIR